MVRPLIAITALAASALAVEPSFAGDVPNPVEPYDLSKAATYSNVCLHRETLDPLGLRVYVRDPDQHPRVLGQYAEGGLEAPLIATARLVNGRLMFTLAGDVPEARFDGEVRGRYVILRSEAPHAKAFRLRRRDDTHGFPICR
jgi:hypothetical protein